MAVDRDLGRGRGLHGPAVRPGRDRCRGLERPGPGVLVGSVQHERGQRSVGASGTPPLPESNRLNNESTQLQSPRLVLPCLVSEFNLGNMQPMSTTGAHASDTNRVQSRQSKADRLTKLLLQAAGEEFIARGYEAARVNDIARRVGVTAGAVYARWPHKTDVIVAALNHMFEQILPDQELESLGGADASPPTMLAVLGTNLLRSDPNREVMVQVFGSARNNEAIRACLVAHLDREADQLTRYVERAKDAGLCDPDISTAAVTLLCQAIGLGSHLLLSAGLDERHVPTEVEWGSLLWTLISAAVPTESSGTR